MPSKTYTEKNRNRLLEDHNRCQTLGWAYVPCETRAEAEKRNARAKARGDSHPGYIPKKPYYKGWNWPGEDGSFAPDGEKRLSPKAVLDRQSEPRSVGRFPWMEDTGGIDMDGTREQITIFVGKLKEEGLSTMPAALSQSGKPHFLFKGKWWRVFTLLLRKYKLTALNPEIGHIDVACVNERGRPSRHLVAPGSPVEDKKGKCRWSKLAGKWTTQDLTPGLIRFLLPAAGKLLADTPEETLERLEKSRKRRGREPIRPAGVEGYMERVEAALRGDGHPALNSILMSMCATGVMTQDAADKIAEEWIRRDDYSGHKLGADGRRNEVLQSVEGAFRRLAESPTASVPLKEWSQEAAIAMGEGIPVPDAPMLVEEVNVEGLAMTFLQVHGEDMRWDVTVGDAEMGWLRYTDEHGWNTHADPLGTVRAMVTSIVPKTPEEQDKLCRAGVYNEILRLSRGPLSRPLTRGKGRIMEGTRWDSNPVLLGAPGNHVIDLSRGECRKGERTDYMVLEVGAVPKAGKPPKWYTGKAKTGTAYFKELLKLWCTRDGKVDKSLVRICTSLAVEMVWGRLGTHMLGIVHGPSRSGKTSFLRAVQGAGGDFVRPFPVEHLLERRHEPHEEWRAEMDGARGLVSDEPPADTPFAAGRVKSMTGGDRQSARHMYGKRFSFDLVARMVLVTNDIPEIPNDYTGLPERMRVFPFLNALGDSRDPRVEEWLRTDEAKAAVMQWIMEEAPRVLRTPENERYIGCEISDRESAKLFSEKTRKGVIQEWKDACVVQDAKGILFTDEARKSIETFVAGDPAREQEWRRIENTRGGLERSLTDRLSQKSTVYRKSGRYHRQGWSLRGA